MTNQEAFTVAFLGLKSQGFTRSLSQDDQTLCRYRGQEGKKCAVGWLIQDNAYSPKMEDTVRQTFDAVGVNYDLAADLMNAHDLGATPILMESKLRNIAVLYSLEVPK